MLLQIGIDRYGWRRTMMLYGILIAVTVPVLVAIFYRPPPDANIASATVSSTRYRPVAGLPANLVLAILAAAIFCCCVTMSIPLAHMVAFCGDIGVGARAGAAMLSLQLGPVSSRSRSGVGLPIVWADCVPSSSPQRAWRRR